MENIGSYKGRRVYKCSRSEYDNVREFGHELYAIIEDGLLVSGDTAIGRVNWRTMDVEDFNPRDFIDLRNKPKKKEVKSIYETPVEPEFHEPSVAVGALSEADLDMILDNAMHNSIIGGIDLDAIATVGDLDVGDEYSPRG